MLTKVISGGQTGVDRIGLEVARDLGISTGGTAPHLYKTEDGFDPTLLSFGLTESESYNYSYRTSQNVQNSDGTVLFGDMKSSGSLYTLHCLVGKKYIVNPSAEELIKFIQDNNINTLNVAGNRGSKLTADQCRQFRITLFKAFLEFIDV